MNADALDIQEEVHNLLFDSRYGSVFMNDIVDFYPSYGAAWNGAYQNAPQGVADGDAVAPLERFDGQFSVVALDLDQANLRFLGLGGTLGNSSGYNVASI